MKLIIVLLFMVGIVSCNIKSKSRPTELPYYYAGQILLPDYVHDDTLIVINPQGLQEEVEDCTGTDYEIYYILHKNCAILNQCIGDYQVNINNFGYTIFDDRDTARAEWGEHSFEKIVTEFNQ